jgi:sirohydrochlorin ferrochelatase
MSPFRHTSLLFLCLLAMGCAGVRNTPSAAASVDQDEFGVLLMAHGGSPEWNEGVEAAVEPLQDQSKIEVAFGMADAKSIQEAVSRLEERGVRKIGVVRLFVSGESWYERTEQILGLRGGAPSRPAPTGSGSDGGHGDHNHSMELWRAETAASFALTTQGLAEAEAMGTVLADRARALSRDPRTEDVLILAHGPGDDSENERWIATIDARAEAVRQSLPFRRVQVVTLREDWPEKRPEAERRIRAYVERARAEGGAAIVIPFRVQGFGPYAQVLDGLEYVSDGHGLMPHPGVTRWIEGQIMSLRRGPFRSPID